MSQSEKQHIGEVCSPSETRRTTSSKMPQSEQQHVEKYAVLQKPEEQLPVRWHRQSIGML
jgi:hypothetical protein